MRILIDGDGCPRPVKESCFDLGEKLDIKTIMYTTIAHVGSLDQNNCIILDSELQSVDIRLANDTKPLDIVVTQDYGLASMVLAKGGLPIGVRGEVFTNENIDKFLFIRHQNLKIRQQGHLKGGPSKFSKQDLKTFVTALTNLVEKNNKNKRVLEENGE